MKTVPFVFTGLLIVESLFAIPASAQKIMILDDSLALHSQPLTVKMKGGTMFKFNFGPYTTIELKAGIASGSSTYNWRFLKDDISQSMSQQKFHFIITGNRSDTARVKVAVKSDAEMAFEKYLMIGRGYAGIEKSPSLVQVRTDFIADISLSTDTTVWSLLVNAEKHKSKPTTTMLFLTNEETQIDIREVFQWNDGKSSTLGFAVGYNFLLNGRSIAAVQSSVNGFQKKIVWIHDDLDENMKLVLAAACAALMEYSFFSSAQFEEITHK